MGIPLPISPPSAAEASRYSRDSLLYCIGEMYRPYLRSVSSEFAVKDSTVRVERRPSGGARARRLAPPGPFRRSYVGALCEAGRPGVRVPERKSTRTGRPGEAARLSPLSAAVRAPAARFERE
jgi:hypothetical protein